MKKVVGLKNILSDYIRRIKADIKEIQDENNTNVGLYYSPETTDDERAELNRQWAENNRKLADMQDMVDSARRISRAVNENIYIASGSTEHSIEITIIYK